MGNDDLIYHLIRPTGIKESFCGFLRREKEVTMKTTSQLSTIFTVAFSCFHFSNMCNYVGDENKITNQKKKKYIFLFSKYLKRKRKILSMRLLYFCCCCFCCHYYCLPDSEVGLCHFHELSPQNWQKVF